MPLAILPKVYKEVGVEVGARLPSCTSIGGYTIIYLTENDNVLCSDCATTHKDDEDPVSLVSTYDEGEDIHCEECEVAIESSYGPVEDSLAK